MSEQLTEISDTLRSFIEAQHLFFVATAAREGRINLSPKGMDSLRVVTPTRVVWRNLTGSGNETAAHVLENGRMTLMFCSFAERPLILRIYGAASAVHPRDSRWSELNGLFASVVGARQLFDLRVGSCQTSCGWGVPFFEYRGDRERLREWATAKGEAGIRQYWRQRNAFSLDGSPTGIEEVSPGNPPHGS